MKIKILLLICIMLTSCYEDKGNYDYKDINQAEIEPMSDQVRYRDIDSLIVKSKILFTQNPNIQYQYQWIARRLDGKLDGDYPEIVLSSDKDLHFKVNLPIGQYMIIFNVTDPTTSLVWSSKFRLTVTSNVYKGWIVLCDSSNVAVLNMIEESSENNPLFTYDILGKSDMPIQNNPQKLFTFSVDLGSKYEIFMSSGSGCSRLVDEDLTWEEANDFRYIMADPAMANVKPQAFAVSMIQGTLMVADNKAFWRKNQGSPLFGRPVNNIDGVSVSLAPFIGNQISASTAFGANSFVLFDQDNNRFLKYIKNANALNAIDGFPEGYQLITMQNSNYDGGTTFAIIEKDNKYSLFSFHANNPDIKTTELIELDAIANIGNITMFAFDPQYPYMYYVDNDKLYLYGWSENKIVAMTDVIPDGDKITMIKYNPTVGGLWSAGSGYPDNNLVVATLNSGGLASLFTCTSTSNWGQLAPAKSWTKLFNHKIVDVVYRER